MRRLRFIPPDALVEVTATTIHQRFLLQPDPRTRDLIVGIIGRAQRRSSMRIIGFIFLSNHCHLLLCPSSARQLAEFMGYVLSNIAREVGRLHGWRDKFWARRYAAIVVSGEEAAQIARLRYLLGQGVKEGLVATPQQWPGAHTVDAMLRGDALQGIWYDRTALFLARRIGLEVSERDFASTETVALTRLTGWESASAGAWRALISELVAQTAEAASRDRGGKPPIGRVAVVRRHPHDRPRRCPRRPAPAFHTATREARLKLLIAYRRFVEAFRRAAARLRAGLPTPRFPIGSFPPGLPFVAVP